MARVLTQMFIDSLTPGDKQFETPDGQVQGLRLVVYPSGVMSWILRFRLNGTQQKYTIGPYSGTTIKEARRRAQKARALIADGVSPSAEKKAERTAAKAKAVAEAEPVDLVESVAERFFTEYSEQKKLRPRTAKEIERLFRHDVLPVWADRRLSTISRDDRKRLINSIVGRGKRVLANRLVGALKVFGKWAAEEEIVATDPFADLRKLKEAPPRERWLDDREIAALMTVLDGEAYPIGPLIRVLVLVGARRSEVAEMKWGEIDLAAKLWRLPRERSKNRQERILPLPDVVVDILRGLPRFVSTDYVFSFDGVRPITCFPPCKARIDAAMAEKLGGPVKPWVLHDLRRTLATNLQRLGVRLEVTECVLGHSGGSRAGIVAVYQKHKYEKEQLQALTAWADRIRAIRRGEAMPENVVQFGQRQGG